MLKLRLHEGVRLSVFHGDGAIVIRRHLCSPSRLVVHPSPGWRVNGQPADRARQVVPVSPDRGPAVEVEHEGEVLCIHRSGEPGALLFDGPDSFDVHRGARPAFRKAGLLRATLALVPGGGEGGASCPSS